MKSETANLGGKSGQRESAAMGLRAGMARDRLIFIIICVVAIAVAGVTMAISLLPARAKIRSVDWQCLECNHEFSTKTSGAMTPVYCPKCSGQTVGVRYGKCPHCGKQVPMYRFRVRQTEQEQGLAVPGVPGPLETRMQVVPGEIQYWIRQADGSYGWSRWMGMTDPQISQFRADSRCPQCEAKLF